MTGRAGRNGAVFILVAFVAALMLPAAVVWAAPETPPAKGAPASPEKVTALLTRFESLAARDSAVTNLVTWEKLGAELQSASEKLPHGDLAAQSLLALGKLYEQTYRAREFRGGLAKATYFYERLAKEYQGQPLVAEALFHLAELRSQGLKDEIAARAALYELVDLYPESREAEQAKEKLGLARGQSLGDLPPAVAPAPEKSFGSIFSSKDESKEIYAQPHAPARPMIVIDPGHGGEELGALGVDGVLEKDVVLQISLMLSELLRDRLRAQVVLTRTSDVTVPLAERTKIANSNNADLFLSIHANASEYKNAKGVETYYLDNTDDKSSLKLADRENATIAGSKDDLSFMLSDFIQSAKQEESISLAHYIQRSIVQQISRYYHGVKDLGVKRAPFYVLVGAHMPCVLVEVSFIDHPVEGKRLIDKRYQRVAASAIYQGVRDYFSQQTK